MEDPRVNVRPALAAFGSSLLIPYSITTCLRHSPDPGMANCSKFLLKHAWH